MKNIFTLDPRKMSPTFRRIALFLTRCSAVIAVMLVIVFVAVGLAHFFLDIGNYPKPQHRYAVGTLFLLMLAPVALMLHFLARHRIRLLHEAIDDNS